jgi:hypothetical protein
LDVSEFLQLFENIVFFMAIHVGKPHGTMEWWNVGTLGTKRGKRSIPKPMIPIFQNSNIPSGA